VAAKVRYRLLGVTANGFDRLTRAILATDRQAVRGYRVNPVMEAAAGAIGV
jgi:hypothetical protein